MRRSQHDCWFTRNTRLHVIVCVLIALLCSACELVEPIEKNTFACADEAGCLSGFRCDETKGVCVEVIGCSSQDDCEAHQFCSETKSCEELIEDLKCDSRLGSDREDALTLGLIMSLSGTSAESGIDQKKVAELAVDEINAQGGVLGAQGQRELAFIVCDDKTDKEYAKASAKYLSNRGVPAVLGPLLSNLLETTATEVAIPQGLFMVSPSSTSVGIRDLDDDDLIWRVSSADTAQARALAYFGLWLAKEPIHADSPSTIRMVGVHTSDNYGKDFRAAFEVALGAYASSLLGGDSGIDVSFNTISYKPASETDQWNEEVDSVVAKLKEKEPHIILFVGYESTSDILAAVQEEAELKTLPLLLSDGVASTELATTYPSNDEMPEHVFGVQPGFRAGAAYRDFILSYQADYPTAKTQPIWTEYTYDAVYLLAYAAASASPQDLNSQTFAQAFKRFDTAGGRAVNVGTNHLLAAYKDMAEGKGIDVHGASGPLDFDIEVGEPKSVGILRWTIEFPVGSTSGELSGCGLAMVSEAEATQPTTYWCNAQCLQAPEANESCEAGTCSTDDAICTDNQCVTPNDCRPETAP